VRSGAKEAWVSSAAVGGSCDDDDDGVCEVGGCDCDGCGGGAVDDACEGGCGTADDGTGAGFEGRAFVSWRVLWDLKQLREQLVDGKFVSEQEGRDVGRDVEVQ